MGGLSHLVQRGGAWAGCSQKAEEVLDEQVRVPKVQVQAHNTSTCGADEQTDERTGQHHCIKHPLLRVTICRLSECITDLVIENSR